MCVEGLCLAQVWYKATIDVMRMLWPVAGLVVLLVVAMVVLALLKGGGKEEESGKETPYVKRAALLTAAEVAFYKVLVAAVGARYVVMAQVSLAGVLEVDRAKVTGERKGFQAAFNRISRKTVDFVLCEPGTMRIVAAVELDDRSHERAERKERDGFVEAAMKAAGLPLVRVKAAGSCNSAGLEGWWRGHCGCETIHYPPKRRVVAPGSVVHVGANGLQGDAGIRLRSARLFQIDFPHGPANEVLPNYSHAKVLRNAMYPLV